MSKLKQLISDELIPMFRRRLSGVDALPQLSILGLLAGQLAWRKFGDEESARSFFVQSVELAPQHPVIRAFLDEVTTSRLGIEPRGTVTEL